MVRVVIGVVGTALFLLCTAVQFNDPDPVLWVVIYAAAASVCVAHAGLGASASAAALRRLATAGVVIATIAAVWAVTLFPIALEWMRGDAAAVDFTMKTGDVGEEVAREFGGLTIVAVWCAAIALAARVRSLTVR